MKEASRIMYKIGKVFNIISIPLAGIFLAIGGFLLFITFPFLAYGVYDLKNAEIEGTKVLDYLALGFVFSFIGIIILATEIVSLIICIKKNRLIENGDNGISPRVFIIVFGALSDNIFYILSGIFSMIALSQDNKTNSNNNNINQDNIIYNNDSNQNNNKDDIDETEDIELFYDDED